VAVCFIGGGLIYFGERPSGFPPGFVNYKKGYTRLTAASDKVYQLLAHGWWFSPASSTTKTGRHEMLLFVSQQCNILYFYFADVGNKIQWKLFH
jgi:hypothetical protein